MRTQNAIVLLSLNTVSHDGIQGMIRVKVFWNRFCPLISSSTMFEHEQSNHLIMHEESILADKS